MSFQQTLNSFFDPVFRFFFGWALGIHPVFGILFIALFITLFTTFIYKYSTNQVLLKRVREETQSIQKQLKETKDIDKVKILHAQMQQHSIDSLKQNLKPMLFTFIPTALVYFWLSTQFATSGKILFGVIGWLGTYILFTLLSSLLLRKLLKVY